MKRGLALLAAIAALSACTKTVTVTVPSPVAPSAPPTTAATAVPASTIPTPTGSPTPTKTPPLDQARVEGKFRGKGFGDIQPTITPKCSKGACGVVATGGKHGDKFVFKGGKYYAKGNTTTSCGKGSQSFPLNGTVSVKFFVTKAKYIGDEWRATAIKSVTVSRVQGGHRTFGSIISTCRSFHTTTKGTLFLQGNQA